MLIELVAYAKQRGVRIIPEIDVSLSLCCSSGLGWLPLPLLRMPTLVLAANAAGSRNEC